MPMASKSPAAAPSAKPASVADSVTQPWKTRLRFEVIFCPATPSQSPLAT